MLTDDNRGENSLETYIQQDETVLAALHDGRQSTTAGTKLDSSNE